MGEGTLNMGLYLDYQDKMTIPLISVNLTKS